MRKIYLHVGFAKTGSSALQSYLSLNKLPINRNGESFVYCSATSCGQILHGEQLKVVAGNSPLKYCASSPDLATSSKTDKISAALEYFFDRGEIPILSQEDWGRKGAQFLREGFLDKINCKVHIIAYVRPQVDWFNSAWWQWYAWNSNFKKPSDVINNRGLRFMHWARLLTKWKENPCVEELSVTPLPRDIISDFFSKLKIDTPPLASPYSRTNTSLSLPLIQLIRNLPIQRGPHDAEIDIKLARALNLPGKTPWAIEQDLVTEIISGCFSDNLELFKLMRHEDATNILQDPKWWHANAYNNHAAITDKDMNITSTETLELASLLVKNLLATSR